jgi:uncharacterized protein
MRARDKDAVAAIRTLIGALDNAGAVPPGPAWPPVVNKRADVPRRELGEADVDAILRKEEAELAAAVDEYRRIGRDAERESLEVKLSVTRRYLAGKE